MNNPPLIPQAFATNGSKNTIQDTRQSGQGEEDATWSGGFPNVTMQPSESGGLPPKGMDFNGIFNAISSPIVHLQKGGSYKFDSSYALKIGGYSKGSVLQSNDGLSSYVSLIDNNMTDFNSNPDSIGIEWAAWAGESIKSSAPVGSSLDHYGTTAPEHYLVCDGAAISRAAYPELYAVIGTMYGAGDGSTTYNLPNKINRFAQGSTTPGQKIDAGLPNVTGNFYDVIAQNGGGATCVFLVNESGGSVGFTTGGTAKYSNFSFDAGRANPTYGASNTVQPPALTVLPCIKYE